MTLTLAPFTVDEVAELVTPAAAPDVHKRTGGLPLLVAAAATRSYRFAHALVRDGIADRLDPATARALHRAAAVALEASADADRAGRIAALAACGHRSRLPAGGGAVGPAGRGERTGSPGL